MNQTFSDLEINLVNDGSTDKSGEICHKYAEKNLRITVIDKTNSGVVNARKNGLDISKGNYIAFIDDDDYIDRDMFSGLIKEMRNSECDIINGGFYNKNNIFLQ